MAKINILDFLENHKISRCQRWIVLLMFLTVIFDGMDIAIMGFIIPALSHSWQLTHMQGAQILSTALTGLIVGALVGGPLADKIGRKKILVVNVFLFGLFTLLCATAQHIYTLMAYRFIAGMAMGGVLPQAATLVSEYTPKHHRSKLITFVFSGFTVGAAIGGFMSAQLISDHGWETVMMICGLLPLILSIILLLVLPESISFMVLNHYPQQKIVATLNRIQPHAVDIHDQFFLPQQHVNSNDNSMKIVLNHHFRFGSFMLWGSYFMGLLLVYLLGSWMPTIIKNAHFTLQDAVLVGTMFQLGGPLGSVFLGWLMDRYEPHKVLALNFVIGAVIIIWMSAATGSLILLCVSSFLVGFCFNGGNTGMNALSSLFFPPAARATGNSWMHGLGRFGAVVSTFAGAWMLNQQWSLHQVLFTLSIPALLIALLLTLKWYCYRKTDLLKNALI
ncbi:aromatic acid/H+ symport family MFS transporter [Neisseriaceae bacterium ESL0693]|nr:aromatic acid/H+ symport family MFS transporter [Neisseriaceae bacterium ESL0693]